MEKSHHVPSEMINELRIEVVRVYQQRDQYTMYLGLAILGGGKYLLLLDCVDVYMVTVLPMA
jgi:hypothetical protein